MNDVIKNSGNTTEQQTLETGFLDLRNTHNIYITSPNLGSFHTLGCRGEQNVIKKVSVSSDFGYVIFDSVVANHDYIDVSKKYLKTMELNLRDVKEHIINLHNAHWSMSIIFSMIN